MDIEQIVDTQVVVLQRAGTEEFWHAEIDGVLIRLRDHEGRERFAMADEDAARHIHIAWDLRHGRVAHFLPSHGMKAFTFKIDPENLTMLLDWLPKKSSEEVRQEVLFQGIAMALAGPALMLWQESVHIAWGIALFLIGNIAIFYRRRRVYIVSGVIMFSFGLAQGFLAPSALQHSGVIGIFPSIAATGLVCWAVHQLSMLTINQQIRSARSLQQQAESTVRSPLVRRIGIAMFAAGIVFIVISVLMWMNLYEAGGSLPAAADIDAATTTISVLAIFATVAGIILLAWPNASHRDARGAMLVLIAGLGVLVWTGPAQLAQGILPDWLNPAQAENPALLATGHILIVLLPAVLAFNHWFTRAAERELDEAAE